VDMLCFIQSHRVRQ